MKDKYRLIEKEMLVSDDKENWEKAYVVYELLSEEAMYKYACIRENGSRASYTYAKELPAERFMTRAEVLKFVLDNPKILVKLHEDGGWFLPQSWEYDRNIENYFYTEDFGETVKQFKIGAEND